MDSKLEFRLFEARQIISNYKHLVRKSIRNNRTYAAKTRKIIKDDKIDQIHLYWEKNSARPLCIRDIKAGVWSSLETGQPWSSIISKILKKDLRMSYRTLSILHPKTQTSDNIRAYWEAVIIQAIWDDMGYEKVFIDEFSISSHRNKFRGWASKDQKPAITAKLDNFSMYFTIAVSSNHLYGVIASDKASTAPKFIYFIDNLLISLSKNATSNIKEIVFIIDNASIHKTNEVDDYARRVKIPLLTIPPYSPALNGAETVIQALKAKVNKNRSHGRYFTHIKLLIQVIVTQFGRRSPQWNQERWAQQVFPTAEKRSPRRTEDKVKLIIYQNRNLEAVNEISFYADGVIHEPKFL